MDEKSKESIGKVRDIAETVAASLANDFRKELVKYLMDFYYKGVENAAEEKRNEYKRVRLKEGAILKRKLRETEFSRRVWNVFISNGITTLGDIIQYTTMDMMMWRNFGKTSVTEVEAYVESFGLKMRYKK